MNKWLAYYSELSNRRECANKRGVGPFFFLFMVVKKRWWEKYSKRMRLCCTLIRELRVVTEPDSEPNSIPYRPATNSWRKCLADRSRDKPDTLQGF